MASDSSRTQFDLQLIDEVTGIIGSGLEARWSLPALLLDADRRGVRMPGLALAIIAAVQTSLSVVPSLDERKMVLQDLADLADKWDLEVSLRDGLLDALISESGLAAAGAANGDPACMLWTEVVGSMGAEGYTLNWLAHRCARTTGAEWGAVLRDADNLIRLRRTGSLPGQMREVA